VEEALRTLRGAIARWPDQTGWRAWLAERLRALGRLDEALAEVRALSQDVPADESYPRQEGEILEERGTGPRDRRLSAERGAAPRAAGGVARPRPAGGRRRGLRGAPRARRRRAPEGAPHGRRAPDEAPKAVAVTVLDHCVIRVRPDGTSSSFSHLVYKVLDEKGVAKYGDLPNRGECYEVRAILPDGRVMLPTGLGEGDYNIEGLVPGTVLEQRYLEHIARARRAWRASASASRTRSSRTSRTPSSSPASWCSPRRAWRSRAAAQLPGEGRRRRRTG